MVAFSYADPPYGARPLRGLALFAERESDKQVAGHHHAMVGYAEDAFLVKRFLSGSGVGQLVTVFGAAYPPYGAVVREETSSSSFG